MRSYYNLLKEEKFDVNYFDLNHNFKISYGKKLEKFIKKN